jgi:ribosome-binding ATPase
VNFDETERKEFLSQLQVTDETCGLPCLVREAYDLLNLQTFYTSGPTETRAWTIKKGSLAPEAAGVIHTDFQKGFIRAEVCNYENYVAAGGETLAKSKGLIRSEGKGYLMQDGDVVLFRFNN